jgi:hypothetical protein
LFERRRILRRGQEHVGEACLLIVIAPNLLQPELVAPKIQRSIQVADAQHRMKKTHASTSVMQQGRWKLAVSLQACILHRRRDISTGSGLGLENRN